MLAAPKTATSGDRNDHQSRRQTPRRQAFRSHRIRRGRGLPDQPEGHQRRGSGQRQENRDLRRAGRVYTDLLGEARPELREELRQTQGERGGRDLVRRDERRLRDGSLGPRPEGGRQDPHARRRQRRMDQEARPRARSHRAQHGRALAALLDAGRERRGDEAQHRSAGEIRSERRRDDAGADLERPRRAHARRGFRRSLSAAMRHFINTQDWAVEELQALLDEAAGLKSSPLQPLLQGRTLALLFLNPSLRTRASFQIGAAQLGATAIVLEPGNGVWGIEFDSGKVMDGKAEEHIVEVAEVLSRYCDLIAMRAFPGFKNWQYDREDPLIKALARHSRVPVINMETIIHPCQELALAMTLQERLGRLKGKKLCLTWTWNPQPLSTAVANSVTMIATKYGMNVSLLCPNPDYVLDERFMKVAHENAASSGGRLAVTHDISEGYADADVVYANSWGSLPYYGDPEREWELSRAYGRFIVDERKMAITNNAIFSHCLPVRRNVEATDGVLDGPGCVAIDEAENRLHVQKALKLRLLRVAGR